MMLGVGRSLKFFGKPEIYNFDVPVHIYDYVFRLQVSVNNVLLVHDLQRQENLCGIKLHPVLLILLPEEQVHLILYQPE